MGLILIATALYVEKWREIFPCGCAISVRAEVSTIRVSEWDQDASLNQTYLLIPSANADGTDFGTAVVGLTLGVLALDASTPEACVPTLSAVVGLTLGLIDSM